MDEKKAAEQLVTIRRIMESATQITVLPGWAAIIGGLVALVGCGLTYTVLGGLDFAAMRALEPLGRLQVIIIWSVVGGTAVSIDVALTMRLARKQGKDPWSRLSQLAAHAMGPPLLAAVGISLALSLRGGWEMIPAIWLLLYGVALWMAGILSIRAPGLLGLIFMLAGITTLFWASSVALAMVALTFGLAHILYGAYLLIRFGS